MEQNIQLILLRYLTQEIRHSLDTQRSPSDSYQLTAKSLQIMFANWLQEFKQAAAELDKVKLENLIEQISQEQDYLVRPLSNLLNNFQFEKMHELAEGAK